MDWIPVPAEPTPPAPTEPEARKYVGFHPWDLVIIINLAFLGMAFLFTILSGPATGNPMAGLEPVMLEVLMWVNNATNLVMMGAIPVAWLMVTRVRPWEGTLRYLGMTNGDHNRWFWTGIGSLLAVVLAAAAIGFGYGLEALGLEPGGDPLFEQIARDGSWALMVGIALVAGVSEEILFRGVLQKWLRWWGQALLFGVVHINQGYWAIGFIVLLSGGFGYLRHRGVPLWSLMLAHFAYDLILLTILKLQVT